MVTLHYAGPSLALALALGYAIVCGASLALLGRHGTRSTIVSSVQTGGGGGRGAPWAMGGYRGQRGTGAQEERRSAGGEKKKGRVGGRMRRYCTPKNKRPFSILTEGTIASNFLPTVLFRCIARYICTCASTSMHDVGYSTVLYQRSCMETTHYFELVSQSSWLD